MNRSFLFVPADSEKKLAKARACGADALVVDLEDAVAAAARPAARRLAHAFIADGAPCDLWLRINALDTADAMLDLRAVMPAAPAGIVLPKAAGAAEVIELGKLLDALEVEHGLPTEQTRILPIATERPAGLFRMHEYAACSARLGGLTWGAEDLGAVLGAARNRGVDGEWLPTFQLARSLCLLAAAAAGVVAIDTVFTDFRDGSRLATVAAAARRDGFGGMLAVHPAQVSVINEAFSPSGEEIERARRIVALFAENPDAGTLGLDGEMIDRPHLVLARRILALAGHGNDG